MTVQSAFQDLIENFIIFMFIVSSITEKTIETHMYVYVSSFGDTSVGNPDVLCWES